MRFDGFPDATFEFLRGVAAHNEKGWFDANRDLYEAGYLNPAQALVAALGPKLRKISPGVQFAPKINGSISRINRDIRFSKDKSPYKTHLDLWFWHGEKRGWACPGFYFRLTGEQAWIGAGMHMLPKEMLARFRDAVVDDKAGKALVAAIDRVEKAGYEVGEPTRKQVPRGYPSDHRRSRFLLYESLHAGTVLPAEAARRADFADICLSHFQGCWPIGKWLMAEVAG